MYDSFMKLLLKKVIAHIIIGLLSTPVKAVDLSGTVLTLPQVQSLKNNAALSLGHALNKAFLWHHKVPTIGLREKTKPYYYFIPHHFTLWQLAPSRGKDVTVTIIDTGIGNYPLENSCYKAHCNLPVKSYTLCDNLNMLRLPEIKALQNHCSQLLSDKTLCPEEVLSWIYEYSLEQTTKRLDDAIKKNFLINKEQIKKIKEEITVGRRGIFPRNEPRFFTPCNLSEPLNDRGIIELLPLPEQLWDTENFYPSHGTHIAGIIGAQETSSKEGISGYAPDCSFIMIKAFDAQGKSDDSTLCQAIKKALSYNPDIINLSLKITSAPSQELLELLKRCPCIIMAAGNSTCPHWIELVPSIIPVASFSCDGDKYPISSFCNYKNSSVILAPGSNIISTASSHEGHENEYLFMSGTSMACACISGLLALILGEFKKEFTFDQISLVLNSCLMRLHNDESWNNFRGTPDIRMALYILHVCKALKDNKHRSWDNYTFKDLVDYLNNSLIRSAFIAPETTFVSEIKKNWLSMYKPMYKPYQRSSLENSKFNNLNQALAYSISLLS